MTHQFSLFGFIAPTKKVPISRERIEEAKKQLAQGNMKGVLENLVRVRERLENFERSL